MNEDSKKLVQSHELGIKTYPHFGFRFCICASCSLFLMFYFLSSSTAADAPLDPTDFLTSHPVSLSEEASTQNVPRQVAIPQQFWAAVSKYIIPEPQETTSILSDNHPDEADHNLSEGGLNVTEDVSSQPEPNLGNNLPERVSLVSTTRNQAMYGRKRQLWRARLSPPPGGKDDEGKDELQKLILQVYSIKFKRTSGLLETTTAAELVRTVEPNETSTDSKVEVPGEPEEKATASKPAYGMVSDKTLQMLSGLLQHPERLDNPFELAEVLFLSGHLKEAALAYKEALNRKGPNQSDSTHDRAWILLQIGNCLRYDDLPAAVQSYRQLIREYPDSPWCDLAKAQHELIKWHLEDKPRTLTTKDVSSDSLIGDGAVGSD